MVTFGVLSSVFDFATFYLLYKVFMLADVDFRTGWFIESFATQVLVIFIIRSHKPLWQAIRPHGAIVLSSIIAVGLAWVVALSPVGSIFGFAPLHAPVILYISALVAVYLVVVEYAKHFFYKKIGFAV
jgi:Mg2+-importing ATPase